MMLGALAFGVAGCVAGLGLGYWISTFDPVSDVSLCWAFRPWPWRESNLFLGGIGGLVGAAMGALLIHIADHSGAKLADRVS